MSFGSTMDDEFMDQMMYSVENMDYVDCEESASSQIIK